MNMNHLHKLGLGIVLALLLVVTGCRKEDNPQQESGRTPDVAIAWFQLSQKLTKEGPGFTPPVAARAFGYTSVALYEAIAPGYPGARSLQGQIRNLQPGALPQVEAGKEYDWDLVANATLAHAMLRFYPDAKTENLLAISQLEAQLYNTYVGRVSTDVAQRSRQFGINMAEAVFQFAITDGHEKCHLNNFPNDYNPPSGPGAWVPTPPLYQRALQPYWGDTRPFLQANVILATPNGPPPYSAQQGSPFFLEGLECYTVSQNLTPSMETIAHYWSDDPGLTSTPPGHSMSIILQILEKEKWDLWRSAELLARGGMALHDAFISCWRTKYITSVLRPVTYIRDHFDPNWNSLLNTPPFPEYTSGHSVQTGATAAILLSYFGDKYPFTDRHHVSRTDINGAPRSYPSFKAMAQEAALSRLYGGIHYRSAIEHGLEQGEKIGEHILLLRMLP